MLQYLLLQLLSLSYMAVKFRECLGVWRVEVGLLLYEARLDLVEKLEAKIPRIRLSW